MPERERRTLYRRAGRDVSQRIGEEGARDPACVGPDGHVIARAVGRADRRAGQKVVVGVHAFRARLQDLGRLAIGRKTYRDPVRDGRVGNNVVIESPAGRRTGITERGDGRVSDGSKQRGA